ncbi:MAG: SCP2 sterol-binding domain-containing protein [Trueperaceae bacterium]
MVPRAGRPPRRSGAVASGMTAHELLRRMPEVLDAEAARGLSATIQYDLSETVHQVLDDGAVRTIDGPAEAPDLIVRIADDDLLALFRGELNPMRAFMTGRVRVRGNVALAQRLASLVDRDRLAALS